MGSGIAHVCALAGLDVRLNDVSTDRIDAGLATINGNIARQVAQGTITEARAPGGARRASGRRRPTSDLADCDLVIEAATENEAVKRKIFADALPRR